MPSDSNFSIAGKEIDPVRGGALILLVGVAVAGYGAYDYTQQSDSLANAVEANATVVETNVETVSQRRASPNYRPEVTFEYRYEGESYRSDNLYPATFTSTYDTRSAAESELEGYEPGQSVTAYVNPDSPGDAFLTDEKSNAPLELIAIGGLFVLFGVKTLVGNR